MRKIITKLICLLTFALYSSPNLSLAEGIRVGAILPLTGGLAEYGAAAKNGITLAQEEFPDLLNKIEFLYEDDRYEATHAISAYQKLKIIDKVDLIYLWGIAPAGAVAPIAESQKVPTMAVTCQRDIGAGKKYVVRFCYQGQEGGKLLLGYLRSQGYKKFGIVNTELAFINTVIQGMRENLKEDESIEIVDTFLFENNDFGATISKLKVKHFDAVGVFLASGQISKFYRQATAMGLKAKTFGTDFFDSLSEVADAKGGMSGSVFPAPSTRTDFVERYRKRFGNDYQIPWAANAYDFTVLLGNQVSQDASEFSAERFLQRLKSAKPFQGASNLVTFHEDSKLGAGFDFPIVIKMIQDQKIVELPFSGE